MPITLSSRPAIIAGPAQWRALPGRLNHLGHLGDLLSVCRRHRLDVLECPLCALNLAQ